MLTGILLTAQIPDLASSENPISAIGKLLPSWMAIPIWPRLPPGS
jgi:hypothetical protein